MKRWTRWFAVTALIGALGFGGVPLRAQTESILYNFSSQGGGGGYPLAGLIDDANGNLYGTASGAGAYGYGAVFMLASPYGQNNEYALYSFKGGVDGYNPQAGLTMDAQGNLYGTTYYGGDQNNYPYTGYGVVFKLSPPYGQTNETVLYTFNGGADGANPDASLIMDAQGNLYGTTVNGGSSGDGVVFKLSPPYGQSNETVLFSFSGGTTGSDPHGTLIMDAHGNLYGITASTLSR